MDEAAMLAAPELRAVICNSVMVREEMRRYYKLEELWSKAPIVAKVI